MNRQEIGLVVLVVDASLSGMLKDKARQLEKQPQDNSTTILTGPSARSVNYILSRFDFPPVIYNILLSFRF